jgi:hypothetical protein
MGVSKHVSLTEQQANLFMALGNGFEFAAYGRGHRQKQCPKRNE